MDRKRKNPWSMMNIFGENRVNPWERPPASPDLSVCQLYYLNRLASKRPKFKQRYGNRYLDVLTKEAALKASPFIVALVSYSDGVELIQGSGTIIESHNNAMIVLTSANLIRRPTSKVVVENILADNLAVYAHSCDGHSYRGEVCAFDFHLNLAAIRFKSETPFEPPFEPAKLAHIDDSIDVLSSQPPFHLRPLSTSFKLTPGDGVIAMGRYFAKPFDLMAAPGEYWLGHTGYDCKELFTVNCEITRCGDGGPLINYSGEVIGVAYYDLTLTPCMPINVAYKWWEHYKRSGKSCRPFLGIEATNLYAADLGILARVVRKFPGTCKGVIVEKVIPDSSADLAGIRVNDVIIQCGGKKIQSFLEFYEIIWDNVGAPIELILVRADNVTPVHLNMVFVEAASDQLNSWPALNKDVIS